VASTLALRAGKAVDPILARFAEDGFVILAFLERLALYGEVGRAAHEKSPVRARIEHAETVLALTVAK
jgi:hypothetical protein